MSSSYGNHELPFRLLIPNPNFAGLDKHPQSLQLMKFSGEIVAESVFESARQRAANRQALRLEFYFYTTDLASDP